MTTKTIEECFDKTVGTLDALAPSEDDLGGLVAAIEQSNLSVQNQTLLHLASAIMILLLAKKRELGA